MNADVEAVIREYIDRDCLTPQDVVKCCLRIHQFTTGLPYYDVRVKLWKMRPGDLIFTKGSFQPLLSYPKIDDTLKGMRCGHVPEHEDVRRKTVKSFCDCRKWFLYYRSDDGKVKKTYPMWDQMTLIKRDDINVFMTRLRESQNTEMLRGHFLRGYIAKDAVKTILEDVVRAGNAKREERFNLSMKDMRW